MTDSVIEKSSNLNRINRSDINKKHIVKVGDTYKIHARVIYPLPSKYYFKMLYDNLDNTGQSFDQNINNSNVINASFKFPSVTNRDSSSINILNDHKDISFEFSGANRY